MASGSGKDLAEYRSLRVCLIWCLSVSFLIVVWFRYTSVSASSDEATFLAAIWARTSENAFYQLFIGAGLGFIGYALAVLTSLSVGGVRRFAGLPAKLFETHDALALFKARGKDYALAPLRDAAALFPGLGFLGTVIGVSIAISGLDAVVETGDTAALMAGLRAAFDTTFFGLTGSVAMSVLVAVIEARVSKLAAPTNALSLRDESS